MLRSLVGSEMCIRCGLEGARVDPALFLDVCRALAGERAAELFDIFM